MPAYVQDVSACFATEGRPGGLSERDFASAKSDAEAAAAGLREEWRAGGHAFLDMPGRGEAFGRATAALAPALEGASRLCVIGIGGSSLGARALAALAPDENSGIAVDFLENVDPDPAWRRHIAPEILAGTAWLVVSKSGATAETLANFLAVWRALTAEMSRGEAARRCVALVQPGPSPLRRIAEKLDLAVIDHDPDLPGRYSALGPTGLLPAQAAGLDVSAIRAGAQEVLADFGAAETNAPIVGAAVQVGLMRARGVNAAVMMPYADRLASFARWWCQLWAESLGKAGPDKSGVGAMPYPARGAVDQHSQLQLWLDGPAGAAFTLIAPLSELGGADDPALDTLGDPDLGYLDGRSRGALLAAEFTATLRTLAAAGRPVRFFAAEAGAPPEKAVGALMMHFMIETALAGRMLGVDPFTQPAVDAGKARAREILSDSGSD